MTQALSNQLTNSHSCELAAINNVLLVKIEGPVWYAIYHHWAAATGRNKPLYESTNPWEKDIYGSNFLDLAEHVRKPPTLVSVNVLFGYAPVFRHSSSRNGATHKIHLDWIFPGANIPFTHITMVSTHENPPSSVEKSWKLRLAHFSLPRLIPSQLDFPTTKMRMNLP